MFREIVRKKQAISREECIEVLKEQPRGVLAVNGDDGYPYCATINHWYNEEDGKIYFHGNKHGHRVDAMKACDKACFTVLGDGFLIEGKRGLNFKSVVVFGRLEIVEDREKALEYVRRLSEPFGFGEEYVEAEIRADGGAVLVYALVPEHMTGKQVNES